MQIAIFEGIEASCKCPGVDSTCESWLGVSKNRCGTKEKGSEDFLVTIADYENFTMQPFRLYPIS